MATAFDVAPIEELPPGAVKIVTVRGVEIGVFNVDGAYHALPNLCFHQWGPLCTGKTTGTLARTGETDWQLRWEREGHIIICPWHSLQFDHYRAMPGISARAVAALSGECRRWIRGGARLDGAMMTPSPWIAICISRRCRRSRAVHRLALAARPDGAQRNPTVVRHRLHASVARAASRSARPRARVHRSTAAYGWCRDRPRAPVARPDS